MKIEINGKHWTIEERPTNDSFLYWENGRLTGSTHYFHKLIVIDETLLKESKETVLRHELTHAFLHETQIQQKDEYTEEELCDFVGIYGEQIQKIVDGYFKNS